MIWWTVVLTLSMAWLIGIQNSEKPGLIPIAFFETSYSSIMVAVSEPVTKALENSGHDFFHKTGMPIPHRRETFASLMITQIVKLT